MDLRTLFAIWAWVEVGVRLNGLFDMHLYMPNSVTDLCALNQVPTILSAYALGKGKLPSPSRSIEFPPAHPHFVRDVGPFEA